MTSFSSPVQCTRRAVAVASVVRVRVTLLKFYVQVFQKFISRQPLVRNLSYLDLMYHEASPYIPRLQTPGYMPRDGATGQNLGHL